MGNNNLESLLPHPHLCHRVSHTFTDRYVVTCDKDRKVRVSLLPQEDPLLGSVEIQSYCLGHTYFVSSCTWVAPARPGGPPLLVTGRPCRRGLQVWHVFVRSVRISIQDVWRAIDIAHLPSQ